jgi:hypothetical protein
VPSLLHTRFLDLCIREALTDSSFTQSCGVENLGNLNQTITVEQNEKDDVEYMCKMVTPIFFLDMLCSLVKN